jgi:hypothetical protein
VSPAGRLSLGRIPSERFDFFFFFFFGLFGGSRGMVVMEVFFLFLGGVAVVAVGAGAGLPEPWRGVR